MSSVFCCGQQSQLLIVLNLQLNVSELLYSTDKAS